MLVNLKNAHLKIFINMFAYNNIAYVLPMSHRKTNHLHVLCIISFVIEKKMLI